ncbi:MAG TPA: hypothetical protein VFZ53_13525, partial [Polyangiaceae bacterium]
MTTPEQEERSDPGVKRQLIADQREANERMVLTTLRALERTDEAETARLRIEEAAVALRASQKRYRTLFELCPAAVYACDASGIIQEFN